MFVTKNSRIQMTWCDCERNWFFLPIKITFISCVSINWWIGKFRRNTNIRRLVSASTSSTTDPNRLSVLFFHRLLFIYLRCNFDDDLNRIKFSFLLSNDYLNVCLSFANGVFVHSCIWVVVDCLVSQVKVLCGLSIFIFVLIPWVCVNCLYLPANVNESVQIERMWMNITRCITTHTYRAHYIVCVLMHTSE